MIISSVFGTRKEVAALHTAVHFAGLSFGQEFSGWKAADVRSRLNYCARADLRIPIQRHVSANCFIFPEPNSDRILRRGPPAVTSAVQIDMRHRSGLRFLLRRAKPSTHGGSLVRRKHPFCRSRSLESLKPSDVLAGGDERGRFREEVSKFPSHT